MFKICKCKFIFDICKVQKFLSSNTLIFFDSVKNIKELKMKKYILFLLLIVVSMSSCSKKILPVYPVKYVNNWPEDSKPLYFDSTSNVSYELQRDEQNLYLHLSTKELSTQMKILRHGLSIYFDPTESKKEAIGFTFPVSLPDSLTKRFGSRGEGRNDGRPEAEKGERQNGPLNAEQMQRRMLQRMYKNFSNRPKEMIVKGFDVDKKTIVLGKDPSDIQVDLELGTDNTLNYYAIIPIKKITAKSPKNKSNFSVGIVSGYLYLDENSGQQMGGFGGAGSGGQGSNAQTSEEERAKRREFMMKLMEQMSKPSEIWFIPNLEKK